MVELCIFNEQFCKCSFPNLFLFKYNYEYTPGAPKSTKNLCPGLARVNPKYVNLENFIKNNINEKIIAFLSKNKGIKVRQ